MIVKDLELKIKEISHIGSLTLAVTFLVLFTWLELELNDEGRLDMGVFFIESVLKMIIIILILRKNQSQQNYCSRSPMDFCSFCHPPFCFVADREEDWKLMAGTASKFAHKVQTKEIERP